MILTIIFSILSKFNLVSVFSPLSKKYLKLKSSSQKIRLITFKQMIVIIVYSSDPDSNEFIADIKKSILYLDNLVLNNFDNKKFKSNLFKIISV